MVTSDENFISIRCDEGFEYEILMSVCDTPAKLLGWIAHLADKSWVTPKLLGEFTLYVSNLMGVDCSVL